MEPTFLALLQAQAGLTALVGAGTNARIYPLKLPQNPTFPAVTYQVISGPRDYTQQGRDGVVTYRVQCNLYARTYDGVRQLRDAFERSLSGLYNVVVGSPPGRVQGVFILNERDIYESALDQLPPGGPYRKIIDLSVTLPQPPAP